MINQILSDTPLVLILASLIFGLFGGIAITCLALAGWVPNSPVATSLPHNICICTPSRQRRESLARATRNAILMVTGGSIDLPRKRRNV